MLSDPDPRKAKRVMEAMLKRKQSTSRRLRRRMTSRSDRERSPLVGAKLADETCSD